MKKAALPKKSQRNCTTENTANTLGFGVAASVVKEEIVTAPVVCTQYRLNEQRINAALAGPNRIHHRDIETAGNKGRDLGYTRKNDPP